MKVLSYLELNSLTYKEHCEFANYLKSKELIYKDIDLALFYSQPFKPDLITELFKGWKMDDFSEPNYALFVRKDITGFAEVDFGEYRDDGLYQICYKKQDMIIPIPRTLDDIINDCQRAGIELEWKQ